MPAPPPARTASRAASSTCSTSATAQLAADVRARHDRVDGLAHLVGGWRGGVHLTEEPLEDWYWLHDLLVRTSSTPRARSTRCVRARAAGSS